jgi:putative ABC transport system substrate-binding protein
MERKSWMHWLNSSSDNRKSKTWGERRGIIQKQKWVALCAFLLTVCGARAEAQEPKKIPRVGVLVTGSGSYVGRDAFPQTLRELGYIEGHNIVIEYRSAEGKNARQPELARELVN